MEGHAGLCEGCDGAIRLALHAQEERRIYHADHRVRWCRSGRSARRAVSCRCHDGRVDGSHTRDTVRGQRLLRRDVIMRDIIALLRSLVLPAGAISGQRIVLDGDLGTIEFFDGNNVRRLRIGQFFDGIEFFSGQASETNPGDVYSRAIGLPVSASRQAQLVLDSPQITNARSTIDLRSASFDNTIAALINMVSVDAQFNSVSFVRRAPVAPAKITANQTLITAEADITGLTLTWTADAAHRYKLTVAGRGALLTTAAI